MSETGARNLLALLGAASVVGLVMLTRPGYFADYSMLGILIFGEILFLAIAKYSTVFFPLLIAAFLCSGIDLPYRTAFLYARWSFLAIGALAGTAIYLTRRHLHLSTFQLVAFFCVITSIVSAVVSAYPEEAFLKVVSLTLLFTYTSTGGRTAVSAIRPEVFFNRLLTGCEIFNALTALSYFVFRWEFFGNPNSLGAVMGVAIIPIMLWGFVSSEGIRRRRLAFGLVAAVTLLMSSFARAGIAAAAVACLLLCWTSRQYRLLAQSIAATFVVAVIAVTFLPQPSQAPELSSAEPIAAAFLYKGHQDAGVLASRKAVWQETWDVIKKNPWFGSGFGTSVTVDDPARMALIKTHLDSWVVREHGNSYLAITEWVGILGVLPFYALVVFTAVNVCKVFSWLRTTGNVFSPAVPVAAVVAAGLVHAGFEDWMFAIGYHLAVFFWTLAFILPDVLPRSAVVCVPDFSQLAESPIRTIPAPPLAS